MTSLLDEALYRDFLAKTHPALAIDDRRIGVPSFVAPLDVREPLLPGFPLAMAEAFRELTPSLVVPPCLYIGTPFERYDQTHLLDEIQRPRELATRSTAAARSARAHVVTLTNVDPSHRALPDWFDAGFVALPSFPDTRLELDVDNFEQHLRRVPRADRSGIRRNIRRFERAGHRLERLSSSEREASELFSAYWPLFRKASVHWQPHTPEYFGGLAGLDPRVHLTVARAARGRLIGFIINFNDGRSFQAGRIGVVPDYHRKDAVYFRLLYHVIEESIAEATSADATLSLEPTGYRMKRHLGASRRPMINLVLGVSPAWKLLLTRFGVVGRWLLSHLRDAGRLERSY